MTTRIRCVRASAVLHGAVITLAAASASAATLTVGIGSHAKPCPGASYTTIQAAVNAASPGDTVSVCAGTYAEQVTVPAGKDGLVLRSKEKLAAVIQAPATMSDPGDIVRIDGAHSVTLDGFTIAGPLPNALFCSMFPRTGVRVDGGGSATIRANRFTDIRSADPSLRGCQNGVAILVGSQPEGEVGTATIQNNTIDAYQKLGIVVDNTGSSASIEDNQITGDGPISTIAQDGIQVSNGADASVQRNTVAGQVYLPTPEASALLFLYPGRLTIVGNQVTGADYGIVTIDALAPEIRDNQVAACTANGIDLDEDTLGTTSARVSGNESRNNGQDGIYVSALSKGNTLRRNEMSHNGVFDAEDVSTGSGTAGTGNDWVHDHCTTDNHGGLLCKP